MRIDQILKQKFTFKDKTTIPNLDIELLLSNAIDRDRIFLHSHPEYQLSENEYSTLQSNLKRRENFEPVAYIVGFKEFYGYEFIVNKDVLIPRPATEALVDHAIDQISKMIVHQKKINILEIGTGSGCISIAVALELSKLITKSEILITSVDISEKALKVANNNLNKYQTSIKKNTKIGIKFEHCDILSISSINKVLKDNIYEIIISNPPYIKSSEISNLSNDIKDFEPHLALDGGIDGQEFYKAIKKNLQKNVGEHTVYIFEGMSDKFIKVE
jgi:release factor glutamine methyltransferase